MCKLTVITNHYNREENKRRMLDTMRESICKAGLHNDVELLIAETGPTFEPGKYHNRSVANARGEWILKQDIDCTFDDYERLIDYLDVNDPLILNIGCNYPDMKHWSGYGNEYAVRRLAWLEVGGEPEWDGYGYEDYGFQARILARAGRLPQLKYTAEDCTHVWRDEIARPMNRVHDFRMTHWPHPRAVNQQEVATNRMRFYELLNGLY